MFGLLMGDEKLQVLEVTFTYSESASGNNNNRRGHRGENGKLTVVTPWSVDELLDIGLAASLLAHLDGFGGR